MNGLVLAGGQSKRMGVDKSGLLYHGRPQREHLYHLLEIFCAKVFISCREEQAQNWSSDYAYLYDEQAVLGPLAGILRAIHHDSTQAWLVVACDLPLLNQEALSCLVKQRDPKRMATAFINPERQTPEPLLTIWEPHCLEVLETYLEKGFLSPRRILQEQVIRLVAPLEASWLKNINEPKEYQEIIQSLNK